MGFVKGETYFKRREFSINEGGTPVNIYARWCDKRRLHTDEGCYWFFIYIFVCWHRFSWGWKRYN